MTQAKQQSHPIPLCRSCGVKIRASDEEVGDAKNIICGIAENNYPAATAAPELEPGWEVRVSTVAKRGRHPSSEENVFVEREHEGYG